MKRSSFILALVMAVVGMAYHSVRADRAEASDLQPAVCIIRGNDAASLVAARDALARQGVRNMHIFPPRAIFGRFPRGFDAKELAAMRAEIIRSPEGIPTKDLDPVVARVVRDLFGGEVRLDLAEPHASQMNDLLLRVPTDVRASHGSYGPRTGSLSELPTRGIDQNSEFMIGAVLVNIIFPESAGGSEDWTDEELAGAMSCIALGLSQYQQYAAFADPLGLEFVYNYYTRIPVSIEPIEGDRNTDPIWIGDALQYLGYQDNVWETHTLNNDTRAQFGTDWVFTAFVVDASVNGCWKGPAAGYYAYGYLGGPFMVIPYPSCAWTSQEGFAHIFIHEAGHIFWALDEYASAGFACTDSSGYLRIPDRNTYYQPCESPLLPCVLNNAPLGLPLPVCTYTLGQIGLADANENTSPDVYEVPPEWLSINIQRVTTDTIYGDLLHVQAIVANEAIPNRNPEQDPAQRIDYAPWLIQGTYRIGMGTEHEVLPVDSLWDESREDLDFFVNGFQPHDNDLYLKVKNCAALETEIQKHIYYVATTLRDYFARPKDTYIEIGWRFSEVPGHAAFTIFRAAGPGGEYVELLDVSISRSGSSFAFRDEHCEAGIEYRYRLEMDEGTGRRTLFETGSVMLAALALQLDQNRPNPFNPSTEIRFSLPEASNITLDIYDVGGHFVSRLAGGHREQGSHAVAWDGRDANGRRASSGIYFYRLKAGKREISRKMVFLQ